jgi:serine/threonine-protein kinase RsbW
MSTQPPAAAGQTQPQPKLDINFPAQVDCIAAVVDKVLALARGLYGETDKAQEIALALTEALANAVKHGSRGDPSVRVQCQVIADSSAMLIVVRDSGPGFDPARVPNPLEAAGLSADHGRGLHMIRQLMDEVRFERRGAEIHMMKRF